MVKSRRNAKFFLIFILAFLLGLFAFRSAHAVGNLRPQDLNQGTGNVWTIPGRIVVGSGTNSHATAAGAFYVSGTTELDGPVYVAGVGAGGKLLWIDASGQIKEVALGSGITFNTGTGTLDVVAGTLGGSLTTGRIPYATGSTTLSSSSDLTWNELTGTDDLGVHIKKIGGALKNIQRGLLVDQDQNDALSGSSAASNGITVFSHISGSTTHFTGGHQVGVEGYVYYDGTQTLGTQYGNNWYFFNTSTGTINQVYGGNYDFSGLSGSSIGVGVTGILIGDIPTAGTNYSIHTGTAPNWFNNQTDMEYANVHGHGVSMGSARLTVTGTQGTSAGANVALLRDDTSVAADNGPLLGYQYQVSAGVYATGLAFKAEKDDGTSSTAGGGGVFTNSGSALVRRMYYGSNGRINIGSPLSVVPPLTYTVSFDGEVAKTIGMERRTTSNTSGTDLTISAGGATSGASDKNGGILTLEPGVSTSFGRGDVRINGYTSATASGTTDNTKILREVFGRTKILANNTATAIVNATLASDTSTSGIIHYSVEVFNGTDFQVEVGNIAYTAINKSGVFSGNSVVKYGNLQPTPTSGTLTVTWTITGANPAVVTLNANSSLTPSTGYPRLTYDARNLSNQTAAYQ